MKKKNEYFCHYFMSKIRQKSNFNLEAANVLINNQLYAPSVHCSYYSCFQLLKYTIKCFFGDDYNTQSVNISTGKEKSHQYVVNYVSNRLKGFVGLEESLKFKRKVNDLKQFRVESDYENIEVNLDKGTKAYEKAKEIRTYLIKNFNV